MRFGSTQRVKAIGAVLLALATPMIQGTTSLDNNLDQRLLASHNRERSVIGIPPLAWDDSLARDAAAYAQHLAQMGYLEHAEDAPGDPDPQGENLWAGTRGHYAPEAMVGLWIAERVDYKPGIFPNNSISGDLDNVGHYTQLMWRSSRTVGCAVAHGSDDDFLVCRYSEGGNVLGERPF